MRVNGEQRGNARLRAGYSLVELTVVLAITGTVAIVVAPTLLSYWDFWSLQAGARELAVTINAGRQLAIASRTSICVDLSNAQLRFRVGGCTGDVWRGPITDASGSIRISDPTTLNVSANGRPVFTTLGAATPGATYTLRHARTHASRTVVVGGSGRITVE